MKLLSSVMVLGLCGSLASAQDALHVDIVGGQDSVVTSAGKRGADFRVRVLDRDRKPVPGATVSAVLPSLGVGGHFRGGSTIATERTDERGEVEFSGIELRNLTGDFTTRVLARSGTRTGSTLVAQKVSETSVAGHGWANRRRLIMLGVIGAGVAAGIVVATHGNGSSADAPSGSITPGTPVTTGPR